MIAQRDPHAGVIVALNALSAFKGEDEQDHPPTSLWHALVGAVIADSLESSSALSDSSIAVVSDAHHTLTTDRVITAAKDGSAQLCEVREAMQINCVAIHDLGMASVRNVALTVDGTRFATAHVDGTTRIWTIGQTRPELSGLLRGHSASVHHVAFSRDATVIATASEDGTARLWTLGGSTPPKLQLTLAADGRALQYITPVASGALTMDFEGHVRFWNLNRSGSAGDSIELANKSASQDTPIVTAGADYSGLYLFSISKNHILCLWTAGFYWERERVHSKQMKHIGCIKDVLDARYGYFDRDRDRIGVVFITSDGMVHFWKAMLKARMVAYPSDPIRVIFERVFDLKIFDAKGNPRFLSFAHDGKHLLIFAERQHLWRVHVPRTPFESIVTGCALMSRAELAGSGNKDLPGICSRSEEAIKRLSWENTRLEGVSGW